MSIPLISVVIPAYNHENFIGPAIESVLNQSINDIELVIVDDGSTDRTLEKLRQNEHSFDNVKIISIENSGPAIATNVGLAEVSKEYVKLVDGDDILHPDATVKLIEACESCGAGLAFGDFLPYEPEEVLYGARAPNLPRRCARSSGRASRPWRRRAKGVDDARLRDATLAQRSRSSNA